MFKYIVCCIHYILYECSPLYLMSLNPMQDLVGMYCYIWLSLQKGPFNLTFKGSITLKFGPFFTLSIALWLGIGIYIVTVITLGLFCCDMYVDSYKAALDRQAITMKYTVNFLICCSSVPGTEKWSLCIRGWLIRQNLLCNYTTITQDVTELWENIVLYYIMQDVSGWVKISSYKLP